MRTGHWEIDARDGRVHVELYSFDGQTRVRMDWKSAIELANAVREAAAEAKAQQKSQQGSRNA